MSFDDHECEEARRAFDKRVAEQPANDNVEVMRTARREVLQAVRAREELQRQCDRLSRELAEQVARVRELEAQLSTQRVEYIAALEEESGKRAQAVDAERDRTIANIDAQLDSMLKFDGPWGSRDCVELTVIQLLAVQRTVQYPDFNPQRVLTGWVYHLRQTFHRAPSLGLVGILKSRGDTRFESFVEVIQAYRLKLRTTPNGETIAAG